MKSLTEEIEIVETQNPSFIEKATKMMEAAGAKQRNGALDTAILTWDGKRQKFSDR